MESLHLSFSRAVEACIFKGYKIDPSTTLSHLFYANDAVFIGEWSHSNLKGIMNILRCFSLLSGMSINIQKSHLLGVGIPDNCVAEAAKNLLMLSKEGDRKIAWVKLSKCLLLKIREGWEFLDSFALIQSALPSTVDGFGTKNGRWCFPEVKVVRSMLECLDSSSTVIAVFFVITVPSRIASHYSSCCSVAKDIQRSIICRWWNLDFILMSRNED
ncbi:hypothetical protein Tco_0670092 [Tanacetum coccineum]